MPRPHVMSVVMSQGDEKRLTEMATHCGVSKALVIRLAIRDLYNSGAWKAGLLFGGDRLEETGQQIELHGGKPKP